MVFGSLRLNRAKLELLMIYASKTETDHTLYTPIFTYSLVLEPTFNFDYLIRRNFRTDKFSRISNFWCSARQLFG